MLDEPTRSEMLIVVAAFDEAARLARIAEDAGQVSGPWMGMGDWFSAQAGHYRYMVDTGSDPRLNCPPSFGWVNR